MRYSLLSRFRGALLGSVMGDALDTEVQSSSVFSGIQQPDWYKILDHQPSNWTDSLDRVCLMMNESSQLEEQIWQPKSANSGESAYMALPIILFYHENYSLLEQQINRIARYWQWSAEILEDVLIWGYIVALILREKLDTKNIIGQLLVGVGAKQTPLFQQLRQVELWLSQSLSLEQVVKKLSKQTQEYSIPLSLYCFSSTPENFYLSICRASQYGARANMTAILTGALAGAYNGIMGIPIAWRKLSYQNCLYQEIDRQGKILFDNWSGVYSGGQKLDEDRIKRKAIAAPGTIQTRSSLIVISQQE